VELEAAVFVRLEGLDGDAVQDKIPVRVFGLSRFGLRRGRGIFLLFV
jgi:hypothetical protein